MREIKFRGKILRAGKWSKWVYGSLDYSKYTYKECRIVSADDSLQYWHTVDKNTIGQYTGLKDKNGKEIYEGDIYSIIKYDRDDIGHKEIHSVKFDEILCKFNVNKFDSEAYEIIGNIYDNPKLLEE